MHVKRKTMKQIFFSAFRLKFVENLQIFCDKKEDDDDATLFVSNIFPERMKKIQNVTVYVNDDQACFEQIKNLLSSIVPSYRLEIRNVRQKKFLLHKSLLFSPEEPYQL